MEKVWSVYTSLESYWWLGAEVGELSANQVPG